MWAYESVVRGSKIRLRCSRHVGVPPGVIEMWVFSTNTFPQFVAALRIYSTPISDGRRPGGSEDALVLYGKLELEPLSLVVGVNVHSNRNGREAEILGGDPLQRLFRGIIVEQP